jgi:anti-sigma-K factor RskA
MNVQSFLESGLLESYILGAASADDQRLVEQMLARHPQVRTERDQIEATLARYAEAQSVAPPAWMRGKIMAQITESGAAPTDQQSAPASGRMGPLSWMLLLLPAIVLGLWAWQLRGLNADLTQRAELGTSQLRQCSEREQELQRQVDFLTNPGTRAVALQWLDPADATRGGTTVVHYNPDLQKTCVVSQLPPLAADQDYQFWVIVEGQPAPIPMSVLAANSACQDMAFQPQALKFAVSVEPKGGSPNGTPTRVVMLG